MPVVAPADGVGTSRRFFCTFEDVGTSDEFKSFFSSTAGLHVVAIACDVGPLDGIELQVKNARSGEVVCGPSKFSAHGRRVFLILDLNGSNTPDTARVPVGGVGAFEVIGRDVFDSRMWTVSALRTEWAKENVGYYEWFPFGQTGERLDLRYPDWDAKYAHREAVSIASSNFTKVVRWYPILFDGATQAVEESQKALILDAEVRIVAGDGK
jgi:hypothetical protein